MAEFYVGSSNTFADIFYIVFLCRHVRCVVATLGGSQGVGAQLGNWKSLHAGFTVWVNLTTATGNSSNLHIHT